MKPLTTRILTLAAAQSIGFLALGVPLRLGAWLACLAWLTLFYVVVKPVAQTIILPFSLLLFNLPTLFVDALLVWWADAWSLGALSYLEALGIAVLSAALFLPFDAARRRRLLGKK